MTVQMTMGRKLFMMAPTRLREKLKRMTMRMTGLSALLWSSSARVSVHYLTRATL